MREKKPKQLKTTELIKEMQVSQLFWRRLIKENHITKKSTFLEQDNVCYCLSYYLRLKKIQRVVILLDLSYSNVLRSDDLEVWGLLSGTY